MDVRENLRPGLRDKAAETLGRLSGPEREALLIKCWMSHDARWFMAVARECGLQVTNRLNQAAAHEVGKVEARRVVQALDMPAVTDVGDCLLVQEVLISLLGPDLLDYEVAKASDRSYQVRVRRCFASENAERAGVVDQYDCGIFARVSGWLEALGLQYELIPSLGRCLRAQGQDCVHTVSLGRAAPSQSVSGHSERQAADA